MRSCLILFALSFLFITHVYANEIYVATTDLNIRIGPGNKYQVIKVLTKGEQVELISKNGNWYRVRCEATIGYAHAKYLSKHTFGSQWIRKFSYNSWIAMALGAALILVMIKRWRFNIRRQHRRDYYRNVYLKSEEWHRKRYFVLERDNWTCVHCGGKATEVHHNRYSRRQIGTEPIHWLVSICRSCHEKQHV
jgi:uncharacterized protein YraI